MYSIIWRLLSIFQISILAKILLCYIFNSTFLNKSIIVTLSNILTRSKKIIQLIIINIFSILVNQLNSIKHIKNNSSNLLFYFVKWVIDKNYLNRFFRQFHEFIILYRATFNIIRKKIANNNLLFIEITSKKFVTSNI